MPIPSKIPSFRDRRAISPRRNNAKRKKEFDLNSFPNVSQATLRKEVLIGSDETFSPKRKKRAYGTVRTSANNERRFVLKIRKKSQFTFVEGNGWCW